MGLSIPRREILPRDRSQEDASCINAQTSMTTLNRLVTFSIVVGVITTATGALLGNHLAKDIGLDLIIWPICIRVFLYFLTSE